MQKYFIYTLTDPISNNIRYIGLTKDLKDRYKRHLQKSYLVKYNKNTYKSNWIQSLLKKNFMPIMEILDEGTDKNICDLERYWIAQFKAWGFKLTNLSEGGEVGIDWTGKKHTDEAKKKMSDNCTRKVAVVEYDLQGNVLGNYATIAEASEKTGCHTYLIHNCCKNKKYYTVNNKTFRYKGDIFDYYPRDNRIMKTTKSISKYDLDGNFIEIYVSQKEAARKNNTTHSNIKRCCEIKYKTNTHGVLTDKHIVVKGFVFRYENDRF